MNDQDLDELYRLMQNWARPHSGKSKEELAKLYFNQRGQFMPDLKSPTHEEMRKYYLGELPAYSRDENWIPQYDALPQRYPSFPTQNRAGVDSIYEMLRKQLGPMKPGVETGGVLPLNDPRIARKMIPM